MLDALAQGLRSAGGILSPGVSKQLDDERELAMRQEQAKKSMIAQRIIAGVEQGAINPELGRTQLAQLGFGDFPQGALGPTPEAQTRMQQLDRQKKREEFLSTPAMQQWIEEGKDAEVARALYGRGLLTSEEYRAAMKEANDLKVVPEGAALVDRQRNVVMQNPRNRPDGTMNERAFATLRTLKLKQASGAPLTEEDWLKADEARSILSQSRMQIDPVTQQPMWSQAITIPPSLDLWAQRAPGQTAPAQSGGDSGVPARSGPTNDVPQGPGRKALTADETKTLRGLGEAQKQIEDLSDTFSPKFSGFVFDSVGDLAIQAGRRLPEEVLRKIPGITNQDVTGTAEWWQRYYQWANDVRAEKFGLTLTANELEAFNRAMPKPSDTPQAVQRGLENQTNLLRSKIVQNLNAVSQAGFNTAQAEALAFPPGPPRVRLAEQAVQNPVRQQVSPQESSGAIVRRIRGQSDFDALPSGTLYMGPDNVTRRKP